VSRNVGATSIGQLRERAPDIFAEIACTAARLNEKWGTDYVFEAEACFREERRKRQKDLMDDVYKAVHSKLFDGLEDSGRAVLRSAGGPGAGDFLRPPSDPERARLDCAPFLAALRARLRLVNPGHDSAAASSPTATCNHRDVDRVLCGRELDERGLHAITCKTGGGVVHWHDSVRDWLARWLNQFTSAPTDTEVIVPAWYDATKDTEKKRQARLDILLWDLKGRKTYVDISFATADSVTPGKRRTRANEDGQAAAERVAAKHARYPGDKNPGASLVPFVIEAHGRLSPEAIAFLQAMVPPTNPDRDAILQKARYDLSVLTQGRLADLLLSAEASYATP
jgi:hypothetical protein